MTTLAYISFLKNQSMPKLARLRHTFILNRYPAF